MANPTIPKEDYASWIPVFAAGVAADKDQSAYGWYACEFMDEIPKDIDPGLLKECLVAFMLSSISLYVPRLRKVKPAHWPTLQQALEEALVAMKTRSKWDQERDKIFWLLLTGTDTLEPGEDLSLDRKDFIEFLDVIAAAQKYSSLRGVVEKAGKIAAMCSSNVAERVAHTFKRLDYFRDIDHTHDLRLTGVMIIILLSSGKEDHRDVIRYFASPGFKSKRKRNQVYTLRMVAECLPGNAFAAGIVTQLNADYANTWLNEWARPDEN